MGVPSQKMAKKLPGGVKLTTPAPQVLAGNYRKALGPGAPTAVTVGGIIAAALHARFFPFLASELCLSAILSDWLQTMHNASSYAATVLYCIIY